MMIIRAHRSLIILIAILIKEAALLLLLLFFHIQYFIIVTFGLLLFNLIFRALIINLNIIPFLESGIHKH